MTSVDTLLTCNDPPDPAQTVAVQGILNEKSLALSALEAQIVEILEFGAILAPIRRLPPEIVGEIFLYFAPGVPDMYMRPTDCPWKLAHVCCLWRSIAGALGQLWSVLDVMPSQMRSSYYWDYWSSWRHTEPYTEYCVAPLATGRWEHAEEAELVYQLDLPITEYMSWKEAKELDEGCRVERTLEVLEECVQRAGTHPLSLVLRHSFAFFPVFHALMKYSARWKDLALDNPPDALWDRFSEESRRFAQLHKIVLVYSASLWELPPIDLRWAANLTDLTLGSVFLGPEISLHIPWSQLTRYSERYCIWSNDGVMWAAYRQLTNVVVLLLHLPAHELTGPPESRVLLPNLQSARFKLVPQEIYAVDHFDMPALNTLSILQSYANEDPRHFDRIFPHPENAPNLKHLRIRSEHVILRSQEPPCRLLDEFPELQTLDIDIGEVISTSDSLCVLPKLAVLSLSNKSFIHQDCLWTTLTAMVQGRFRPPPDSGVRPLRTLFFALGQGRESYRKYEDYRDPVVFAGLEHLRQKEEWDIQLGRDSSTEDFEEPGW
ncbi:hypothetical protein C8J57DRAFT_1716626 [Mycena rebaudengoi]|nr:hypothetical protein C8J57DRAFT_1716626 [Mycena rebaudengoi]